MIGSILAKFKIASAFNALNRRDLPAFLSGWRGDCVFIYPGTIHVSGKMVGKSAIENWFNNFALQFPSVKFTLKNVCVENIFDFVGTNTVAAHWDVELINRNGDVIQNSGVTIINLKFGKAVMAQDYIFDTGEKFRIAWGAANV